MESQLWHEVETWTSNSPWQKDMINYEITFVEGIIRPYFPFVFLFNNLSAVVNWPEYIFRCKKKSCCYLTFKYFVCFLITCIKQRLHFLLSVFLISLLFFHKKRLTSLRELSFVLVQRKSDWMDQILFSLKKAIFSLAWQ